ncbi:hypothetical protein [Rhizobium sp. PAMB 3182]
MLFGQSVFQSVLERLKEEHPEIEDEEPSYRVRGLGAAFVAAQSPSDDVTARGVMNAYMDFAGEAPPPEPEPIQEPVVEEAPVMPEHLSRIDPQEVSDELALSETDTVASLHEKRRLFAKANHPDSVLAAFRDNANIRMMIANLLIDEALRRLKKQDTR